MTETVSEAEDVIFTPVPAALVCPILVDVMIVNLLGRAWLRVGWGGLSERHQALALVLPEGRVFPSYLRDSNP